MRSDDMQRGTTVYESVLTLDVPPEGPVLVSSPSASVPLAIFSSSLSGLRALVRYLHESRGKPFVEIAALLNRSQKTIWTTYAAAKGLPFSFEAGGLAIPLARFASREFSPLETVVAYLRELGYANVEIARLLRLDPRTTWTVQHRAERKAARREVSP